MYANNDYYLHGDPDNRAAFMAGYLAALRVNKHPVPVSGGEAAVESWIETTVMAYEIEVERQVRARINKILDAVRYDKEQFRGFMFDTDTVDDAGCEISDDGREISDWTGCMYEDEEHREWPNYTWLSRDGSTVSLLAPGARKVRYVYLGTSYLGIRLLETDCSAIEEVLKRDIATGDPIVRRYELESQPGGRLEDYADVINKALLDLAPKHFFDSAPKMSGYKPEPISHLGRMEDDLRT